MNPAIIEPSLMLTNDRRDLFHFKDQKTATQNGKGTHPHAHDKSDDAEQSFKSILPSPEACTFFIAP